MMQQTSISAYHDIKETLGERQIAVYECLKDLESANNNIIARKLKLPINRITPRVHELRERGLVVKDCIRPCPITKKLTWFWRLNPLAKTTFISYGSKIKEVY